jgi:hypothetical protein
MPEARFKGKLPIEIVAREGAVVTNLYATSDPRFSVGLYEHQCRRGLWLSFDRRSPSSLSRRSS